jgi:TolB protein
MFTNVWKRGRIAALSAVCVAGLLGAGVAVGAGSAGASVARPQAGVPWAQVGPGWTLVEYTNATMTRHAATTLYVVSPGGAKYPVHTWPASATFGPNVIAWSGDKTRVLYFTGDPGHLAQLNLQTGKVNLIDIQGTNGVQPIGYTRPHGLNILGMSFGTGNSVKLVRYSLTGKLVRVLATGNDFTIPATYSADGTTLAVLADKGLELVGNAGGVIRQLPVPGTDPRTGCTPLRWWNSTTILASCMTRSSAMARLWLVPASGAKPAALTPVRKPSALDEGDIGAWRLNSGLYLQSLGACGTILINKQNANGSLTRVNVPGTINANNRVVTAQGQNLLVDALTACSGTSSLLWFNPATHAEKWLFRTPAGHLGVLAAIPFYSTENAGGQ